MNKIEALRRKRNLTQEQLGTLLSVNQTAVSKWENGQYPMANKLPEIAKVLGCTRRPPIPFRDGPDAR